MALTERDKRVGERNRVRRRTAATVRNTGLGIERTDVVQALLVVGLCRTVSLALAREHVHDDWAVGVRRVAQRGLERVEVVTVERSAVVQPERADERGDITAFVMRRGES